MSEFRSLNAEEITTQLDLLVTEIERTTGKSMAQFYEERKAAVAAGWKEPTLQEIVDEAGWCCDTCANKGGDWCDELQGALYNGCPSYKPDITLSKKDRINSQLERIKTRMRQLSIEANRGKDIHEELWQLSGQLTNVQIDVQKPR